MRLVPIGVGQAGGKVVDALLRYEQEHGSDFLLDAVAINTAQQDLRGLEHIPSENRHLFGQAHVEGNGVGADNELAAEIAQDESIELLTTVDDIPVSQAEAFLIVAGLGGGTGSGMAPVLARELGQIYTQPIYGLGILPGTDEGGIYSLNAARSLQTLTREADSVLVADNDVWRASGESVTDAFEEINREIAQRFGLLFSAGEFQRGETVAESVIDSSEIINTLQDGRVAALGYATSELESDDETATEDGLLGKVSSLFGSSTPTVDDTQAINMVTSLIRRSLRSRVSLPCDLSSVRKALVLVAGPPEWLNRKGIEKGRRWVEDETASMEVRGGDYPMPGADRVSVLVLLSGISRSDRLDRLDAKAVEAQDASDARAQRHDGDLDSVMADDRLDSLF